MLKLKIEDLEKIRDNVRQTTNLREGERKARITVHMGTCGRASGAQKIMDALLREIKESGVHDVILTTSGCAGLCSREPMATVELREKAPVKYVDLTEEKICKIFNEHVLGKKIVFEYALVVGSEMTCWPGPREEALKMESIEIDQIIDKYRYDESGLIGILQDIQEKASYLSQDTLRELARRMGVPLAQVLGLATFYKGFSLKPRGRHLLNVCLGTTCHVKGGKNIVDKLKKDLGIEPGETTSDRRFTLEAVRCVGCCGLAPAVKINEDFHGKLTQSQVSKVLVGYD